MTARTGASTPAANRSRKRSTSKEADAPRKKKNSQKENAKKKEKQKEAEELELEKPHEEEPNQQACLAADPDGYCDTGLADLIISQIGVEQQNIVTDPLLNAWQDSERQRGHRRVPQFLRTSSGRPVTASPETLAGTLFNQTFGGVTTT